MYYLHEQGGGFRLVEDARLGGGGGGGVRLGVGGGGGRVEMLGV